MAYGEYANAGKCTGKLLYQLSKIGIPLRIVESVIFLGDFKIQYSGELFATYVWADDDTPYFTFLQDPEYDKLQRTWRKRYRPPQDFVILNVRSDHVDACAQFLYRGYQISMSTIGISAGACRTPVAVLNDIEAPLMQSLVAEFNTVSDAIRYIDGDTSVVPVSERRKIIHVTKIVSGD